MYLQCFRCRGNKVAGVRDTERERHRVMGVVTVAIVSYACCQGAIVTTYR